MTAAPAIETARLLLRPHRLDDFAPLAAFHASERSRFTGGPLAPRQAWYSFAAGVGSWDLLGFGAWAIEEAETGAFAGEVSLNDLPDFPERELGWTLMPGFEGKGYATEAARAARGHAYGVLGWSTLVSYVAAGNDRSAAVARRLGCTEDREAARPAPDDLVFRHPSPEALT
jgi:RimJ/RimL family protein N-acetyltransferase